MNILNIFKSKIDLDSEKYQKDKILYEQWIEHYLLLILYKPQNYDFEKFEKKVSSTGKDILNNINGYITPLTQIEKTITTYWYKATNLPSEYLRPQCGLEEITESTYFILIRFPNAKFINGVWSKIGGRMDTKGKENYKFTPLQTIKFRDNNLCNISASIDFELKNLFNISNFEPQIRISRVDEDIMIDHFDGIQYWFYPLSKRTELYSKYPELDKEIFNESLPKFAKWLIAKDSDPAFKKYVIDKAIQIFKKYKIKYF